MPKKKKKAPVQEFELNFSDITMVEAEGKFKTVSRLMKEDSVVEHDWCIKTRLTIVSQFGEGNFTLNLFSDGRVFVIAYSPSTDNMYYNPDLRCLSVWCDKNGWKIPQPSPDVAKERIQFWKYFWETMIIDSDYFEKRFGKRKSEDMREAIRQREESMKDEDEEDVEIEEEQ